MLIVQEQCVALLCKEEWRKPKSEGWNYVVKVAVEGKDVLGVKDESVKVRVKLGPYWRKYIELMTI